MISNGPKLIALVSLLVSLLSFATTTNAAVSQPSVTLAWDASSSTAVTGYRLYQGVASQTYTNTINVGNVTSYTVTGLVPGVTYFFAVSAYDTNGLESALSSEVSYTVPTTPVPLAKLQVRCSPGKQVLLTGTGPVGYKYDVQTSAGLTNWSTIGTVTADTNGVFQFTDNSSATNGLRCYRVRQAVP